MCCRLEGAEASFLSEDLTTHAHGEAAALRERGHLYRWLSRVFLRELSADDIGGYSRGSGRLLLQGLAEDERMGAGATMMLRQFDGGADGDDQSRALAGFYGRLFHGVGGRRSVPPYQSVYESEERATHGEAWRRMRAVLADLGLAAPEGSREPEDHVAIQLAVMAHLCDLAGDAAEGGDTGALGQALGRRRDFLTSHLLAWVPTFCADCQASDGDGFYAGAASVLAALLEEERAALGVAEATPVTSHPTRNDQQ